MKCAIGYIVLGTYIVIGNTNFEPWDVTPSKVLKKCFVGMYGDGC